MQIREGSSQIREGSSQIRETSSRAQGAILAAREVTDGASTNNLPIGRNENACVSEGAPAGEMPALNLE